MRNIIEKKIIQLKKKYKTNNPFDLCDYLGIKIFYEDLGNNVSGFYQCAPRNKIIHINSRLNEFTKYFTCSHELGHAILHSKLNILFLERNTNIVKNRYENEADYFSAELYLNGKNFYDFNDLTLEEMAGELSIPIELLRLKLK